MDDYFAGSLGGGQPRTQVPPPSYPPAGGHPPPQPAPYQPLPVEPPPFARVGWAPPPGTMPAPVYAPPTSNRGVGRWIALGVGVVVLVLVAAAVQVGMKERSIAARTTVSLPPTVLGMPHLTDAAATQAESMAQAFPGPGAGVVGVYGAGSSRVVVVAAKYRMGGSSTKGFLDAAESAAKEQGFQLSGAAPGHLGGTFRCGNHRIVPMTLCVFTDPGSYGVIMVTGGVGAPTDTARSVREAVVRRS